MSLIADFVSPLRPAEPWSSIEALGTDYLRAFFALTVDLRQRAPRSRLAIVLPDAAGNTPGTQALLAALRRGTEDAARAAGFAQPIALVIPNLRLERRGCDRHYTAADEARIAAVIIRQLEAQRPFGKEGKSGS
ncbi:hypothetical protein [uncultured Sphingomonas sp.]|uniref:hypothetical protein n=1 Tax=uncultured Sphingomonas sp. TaxID=158754 RepID=UPI0025DF5EBB|nr:hypothetical protein [uncultured Sphingomonas sp.]